MGIRKKHSRVETFPAAVTSDTHREISARRYVVQIHSGHLQQISDEERKSPEDRCNSSFLYFSFFFSLGVEGLKRNCVQCELEETRKIILGPFSQPLLHETERGLH